MFVDLLRLPTASRCRVTILESCWGEGRCRIRQYAWWICRVMPNTIHWVGVVVLLEIWVMLCVLMVILVIKIVHARYSSSIRSSIDTAMLSRWMIRKHAVRMMSRRLSVRRSRRWWSIGRERWSYVIGWCAVSKYLMPWLMGLCTLWIIVIRSALRWKPVTICHLIQWQAVREKALTQRNERRPVFCVGLKDICLGRGFRERKSNSSSLAHRSAWYNFGASITVERLREAIWIAVLGCPPGYWLVSSQAGE